MTEVRAKKALGQHFLVDLNIARKICDALSGGVCIRRADAGSGGALVGARTADAKNADASVSHDASVAQGAAGADAVAGREGAVVSGGAADAAGGAAVRVETADAASSGAVGRRTEDAAMSLSAAPCDVLEVGCGMGVLTQFLLRRTDMVVHGAEIDTESVAYLRAHYPEFTPRLIEGDFLKMDLRTRFPRGLKIIGNFPYNISSQIFFKVLEHRDLVPECVGMIQKEVAVRLAEPPGSKEYGILSVLLQAWYDIEYLFTVNETVFNPPPKVKSAVIRLRRNGVARLGCDERLFVRVVKAAFGQRRKMVRNALKAAFGNFGGEEHPFFTKRAEQLSVADFVALTNWVAEHAAPAGHLAE